jgi:hypothetical protein
VQAIPFPRRRPFALQMVFALHVYAFLLLLYGAAIVVSAVEGKLEAPVLIPGSWTRSSRRSSSPRARCTCSSPCRAFTVLREPRASSRPLGLAIAVLAITLAYRFGLLVLTLRVT